MVKRLSRQPPTPTSRRRPNLSISGQSRTSPSYHSRRLDQDVNTGRQQARDQNRLQPSNVMRFWLQRTGLLMLLVVSLACIISALSLSTSSRVVLVQSVGSSFLHDQATYQTAADKLLASSFWNGNKITVNTADISRRLIKQFPELSAVNVVLPLLAHRPVIYLTPSQPAFIMIGNNGSFVIDTTGKALQALDSSVVSATLKLLSITDQSGLNLKLNQVVLSSSDVSFIQTVIAQLAAKQVTVSSMTLPAASRELDAAIVGQTYLVKFNLQSGDALQQAGTYLAVKARLTSQNIVPGHYIDVRVQGRAYYQ